MHLVYDIYLIARPRRTILYVLPNLAHFIDAAITGAIDFENVLIIAAGDGFAVVALIARRWRWAVNAIQGLRENARRAGLADAACAREEISMSDALTLQGIDQGLRDGFLANQIAELLRPITAGEDGVVVVRRRHCGGRRRFDRLSSRFFLGHKEISPGRFGVRWLDTAFFLFFLFFWSACGKERKDQSGVKPPHSKAQTRKAHGHRPWAFVCLPPRDG